jgi:hypothetical protein
MRPSRTLDRYPMPTVSCISASSPASASCAATTCPIRSGSSFQAVMTSMARGRISLLLASVAMKVNLERCSGGSEASRRVQGPAGDHCPHSLELCGVGAAQARYRQCSFVGGQAGQQVVRQVVIHHQATRHRFEKDAALGSGGRQRALKRSSNSRSRHPSRLKKVSASALMSGLRHASKAWRWRSLGANFLARRLVVVMRRWTSCCFNPRRRLLRRNG